MRVCLVTSQFEKLGVEYVSAALKAAGHEVVIAYDPRLFVDSFQMRSRLSRWLSLERQVVDAAVATRADAYAISVLSPDWRWGRRMATALKQRTGRPVIAGGLHVSAEPAQVLAHPDIDYAVTGEAEGAVVDLVDALDGGRDPLGIGNVGLVRDGAMVLQPNRALVEDLDQLPWPDKSIYYEVSDHFRFGYNIMAARGCPKACSYCFNSWYRQTFRGPQRYVRWRSVEDVIAELERAKADYGIEHVRFLDDDFVCDHEWFFAFADAYQRRIGLPYRLFVDADSLNEEVIRRLDESGCFEVEMGVQTIAHDVRTKLFKRGQVEGQVREAIDLFARTRVTLVCDNIFGYPGQQPEEIGELLRFYNQHRPDRVQNLWLRYWPGATIVDVARRAGHLTDEQVREICEDPSERGCVIGDPVKDAWQERMSSFLYASFYLPQQVNEWWIDEQRFTRFPRLPDFTSYAAVNWANAHINMYGRRFVRRYAKYGLYKALGPARRLLWRGANPLSAG
jgi:anaerobic magnesium-protoporphyrin IX monomethyl ester cyclase